MKLLVIILSIHEAESFSMAMTPEENTQSCRRSVVLCPHDTTTLDFHYTVAPCARVCIHF